MYCGHCGIVVPDSSLFCNRCGASIALPDADAYAREVVCMPDTSEPLLTLRPVFIPSKILMVYLPLWLFLAMWSGGMLGLAGLAVIKQEGLSIPETAPFVFSGILMGAGCLLLGYLTAKKSYTKAEYRFYRDRIEYSEGFFSIYEVLITLTRRFAMIGSPTRPCARVLSSGASAWAPSP